MAITLLQTPDVHNPVYNPLNYLLSSTNTAQANFKYICDVYIDGAASYTYRLTKSADPDFGRGHFDIHNSLQEYVTGKYISKSDDGFEKCDEGHVHYICKFGEQYGPSSGVTNYTNLTVDSTRHVWQGYVEPLPFISYNDLNYTAQPSGSFRFLTEAPNNMFVRSDEDRWLHMISCATNGITGMTIITYNSAGAILQTVAVTNNFASIGAGQEDRHLLRFPAGNNMNDIAGADITAGAQPIITASVAKYTLSVRSTLSLASSGTTTYRIDDGCSKFTKYTLTWRNQLGGFDTKSFILQSKKKVNVKRDSYKKVIGTLASTSFTYASTDRADTVYNVGLDDEITINSDWMADNEQQYLEQLVTSPEVYHDDDTYGLVSISIKDTFFDQKKRENDKLINMTVTFSYAVSRYRK